MQPLLNIFIALLVYGVFHSLMAAIGFKALMVSLLGERAYLGLYRLFYNLVSVITLAPILIWAAAEPGKTVWSLEGAVALAFMAVQGLGLLGLAISLLQIDWMRFAGLKQFIAYLNGDPLPLPEEPLTLNGVYALVRHPLYLFSLMFLWFSPIMTASSLGFVIGATVYFVVGSLLEERKLVRQFGQPYVEYQKRVPWMIPFLKLR